MTRNAPSDSTYWGDVADQFVRDDVSATWRAYMQSAYRELMKRWFENAPAGHTLKTDLFEEAVTPYHLFGDLGSSAIGLDISPKVVHAAANRIGGQQSGASAPMLVSDLRHLPFASGSLKRILSGSSLDHFESKSDIAVALAELERCLAPGGCLVVTFDNPHNPVVRLRNGLPFKLVTAARLVPYFVGATYSRSDVNREFELLGLRITHISAVVHVPRAPAIWLAFLRERLGGRGVSRTLLRLFRAFDMLEHTPLRFRSGYYLAVRAEKRLP